MRDTTKVFAEALDQHITRSGMATHPWETESIIALADELDLAVAELYVSLREFRDDESHIRRQCLDVAANAMMIFSQHHPLTRHNRCGMARHAMPRLIENENERSKNEQNEQDGNH